MSKICPLFFASGADLEEFDCRPDRCAWAFDGGCAVTAIARRLDEINGSLDDLDEHGIGAWIEKEAGQ